MKLNLIMNCNEITVNDRSTIIVVYIVSLWNKESALVDAKAVGNAIYV